MTIAKAWTGAGQIVQSEHMPHVCHFSMPVRSFRVGIVESLSVHYQLIVLSYQTHSFLFYSALIITKTHGWQNHMKQKSLRQPIGGVGGWGAHPHPLPYGGGYVVLNWFYGINKSSFDNPKYQT